MEGNMKISIKSKYKKKEKVTFNVPKKISVYDLKRKIYELLEIPIKKYDCKPENICFMSSNTWDISGGGVFGYNAVWVNRFNKVFDKLSYKPKFVINNLKGLLDFI